MQIQSLYTVVRKSYCWRIEEVLKLSRRTNELEEEDSKLDRLMLSKTYIS